MPYELIDDEAENTPKKQEESYAGQAIRTATGLGSSALSGFLGTPRALAEGLKSGSEFLHRKTKEYLPESLTQESPEAIQMREQTTKRIRSILPKQEAVKETIGKALPEDYLVPQNEYEQLGQEFASDIGSLLFPVGGQVKVGKALAVSGAGNIASFMTKKIGGSEQAQAGVKIGTMLATSFGMQSSLKKRATEMYKQIDEAVPNLKPINAKPIQDISNNIYNKWSGVGDTEIPSKAAVNRILNKLGDISSGNKIKPNELLSFKQDMGESIAKAYEYPRARPYLVQINEAINNTLKNNPEIPKEFSKTLEKADEIWSGISKSKQAIDFMKNNSKISKTLGATGLAALGYGLVKHPEKTLAAATGAAAVKFGAVPVIKLGYAAKNLLTNKSIQKEYANMMGAALKESSAGVIKHGLKLDEEIKKIEAKNNTGRYELLD